MFLLINYSTRLNDKVDKDFEKIDDIEKLNIDDVNRIESVNDICEEELLSLLLSNLRFFKYCKCVNNWDSMF